MPQCVKKQYKWIVLIACIVVYSSGNLVRWNYTGISSYLISEWGIGKPELGILGAAFFYAYAAGQSIWGGATDIFGGRKVIPFGVLITAGLLAWFAAADGFNQALVIRACLGFVGAASFVPCMALLSKWFGKKDRGMALNLFSGVGGGSGEAWSFLLMPVVALFMTGGGSIFGLQTWRASTLLMAGVVLVIAGLGYLLLRSDPVDIGLESIQKAEDSKNVQRVSYKDAAIAALKDPSFWVITLVWQGFTVSLRLIPGWLPIYAAAYYRQGGMTKEQAMVAGGAMATMYVAGRIIGTPLVGKFSDYLLSRYRVPRTVILLGIHCLILLCLFCFTRSLPNPFVIGVLCFFTGVFINMFPLVNAAAAEIWSIKTGGLLMGLINTVGQFIGATALTFSGFMAVRFAVAGAGYSSEFRGIWFLAMIFSGVSILASLYMVFKARHAAE